MVALQCAMATSLQGCETVEAGSELSLSFVFLSAWTLLLATRCILRSMGRATYVPRTLPSTLNLHDGPKVQQEESNWEGLVTLTLHGVLCRIARARAAGNIGKQIMYTQSKTWLESCLSHLPQANQEERESALGRFSRT